VKALVLHGIRDLRLDTLPEPQPGPGQVKVRVRAVGICGSDIHYYKHGRIGNQVVKKPMIVGHEAAGEVAALGPGVKDLKVGQRLAIDPAHSCGHCAWCLTSRPNLCPNVQFCSTPPVDGLMCEYAVLEASQCLPVPDSLSLAEAAMLEPFQVSVHAANLVGMRPGETAAVVGAGAIGIGCLQVARAGGAARVIVTDRLGYRLKIAKRMGADATIHVGKEDPAEAMNRLTDGHGPDLVFECTNRAAGVVQAIQVAAIGARVACVGIAQEDAIPVDPHEARRKELRLVFTRRSRWTMRQALALVVSGRADNAGFITHRFDLEHAAKGFALMEKYEDGVVKAVILP